MILKTLKTTVMFCVPNLVFEANDISACSLRAAGAMSLFCAGVYNNIIKLIG